MRYMKDQKYMINEQIRCIDTGKDNEPPTNAKMNMRNELFAMTMRTGNLNASSNWGAQSLQFAVMRKATNSENEIIQF